MQNKTDKFVPALGANWATRFYDPLVRITTREFTFKRALIKQANLNNNQTILDLACGTGTLSIGIKNRFPQININAIDVDCEILETAKNKALANKVSIDFQRCFSYELPFEDNKFDRIFSTLSFHHLTLESKIKTIGEIIRVLRNDGEFHLADYGLPDNYSQKFLSNIIKKIDGEETTSDNLKGRLLGLLLDNGFGKVEKTGHFNTVLGTIRLFRAYK